MQARVSVVDPLPVVKARIETPPTSVAPAVDQQVPSPPAATPEPAAAAPKAQEANAPIEPIKAIALKGQILSWWLTISNIGTVLPDTSHHGRPSRAHPTLMNACCGDFGQAMQIAWSCYEACKRLVSTQIYRRLYMQVSFLSQLQWLPWSNRAAQVPCLHRDLCLLED